MEAAMDSVVTPSQDAASRRLATSIIETRDVLSIYGTGTASAAAI
jgi:hypothetical protein